MKNKYLWGVFLLLCVFNLKIIAFLPQVFASSEKKPFAVVELFTSEGCSSCPPADRLLSQLTALSKTQNSQIFTLSFHVDYWDYLGWKDPFSKAQFTYRQQHYAQVKNSTNIYTPQMIINGTHILGGYREDLAQKNIDTALNFPAQSNIELTILEKTPQQISLQYKVSDGPQQGVLNIALVQRELSNDVKSGENAGRQLKHNNVVRSFETVSVNQTKEGTIQIQFPKDRFVNANSSIIAYIQDTKDMHIWGAEKIDLSAFAECHGF